VPDLFDMRLRALRRDRAARQGPELFLYERTFEDCVERIMLLERRFARALLIGCPGPEWRERLSAVAGEVDARDPGPLFAAGLGTAAIVEDAWEPRAQSYDLVLAVGTLDSVNDLPVALRLIGYAMQPNGLFIGAMSGGDTLPQLRAAMRAADAVAGAASAHVHPRVEAAALCPLLEDAGFVRPVVDVDRVRASYRTFERLVGDLRAMGATNLLQMRGAPLGRPEAEAAARAFGEHGEIVTEIFEILHFAAWIPANG
jgi:SAM-dependent methyltransferase